MHVFFLRAIDMEQLPALESVLIIKKRFFFFFLILHGYKTLIYKTNQLIAKNINFILFLEKKRFYVSIRLIYNGDPFITNLRIFCKILML